MRSLRAIQIISKILRVLCIIVFICAIIGTAGCIIALPTLGAVVDIPFDDTSIREILLEKGINVDSVYVYISIGLLNCIVVGFLAKWNELFFKREIEDGTPFSLRVVKDMRTTSIINIAVSLGAAIIAGIVIGVCEKAIPGFAKGRVDYGNASGITFGIVLLVISLFCQYPVETATEVKSKEETINKEDYLE